MPVKPKRYVHVPLYVDAVQVTKANMEEVAAWCGGAITKDEKEVPFIRVATLRPTHDRQTRAYVNDYVLKTDAGLKVYKSAGFNRDFTEVPIVVKEEATV